MSRVQLGTDLTGKSIWIDVERFIETRAIIQANSGAGKSYSIRKLLEATHGKVQQIVLDMEGEFGTLRSKYDYILAGKGGDIPADPRTAELLARKVLELEASLIVDLYELKKHERILFVKNFIDAMVNSPKELWHPVLIVIDEAHVFVPEKGESAAAGAVVDLATRGRKRGFCAVLATQRLSKLNKDVAAECLNKLIGRTSLDIDRKRAGDELGFIGAKDSISLRNLEPGNFYFFGPAIGAEVRLGRIDPVETSHPKAGHRIGAMKTAPTAKIKAVLQKLVDLPKEAQAELADKSAMTSRIRELEKQVREASRAVKVETKFEKVADPKAIAAALSGFKREFSKTLDSSMREFQKSVLKGLGSTEVPAQPTIEMDPPKNLMQSIRPKSEPRVYSGDTGLGACERKILGFLSAYPGRSFSKTQVAVMSGYSQTSSGFSNAISKLNTMRLINRLNGGNVEINPNADVSNLVQYVPHSLESWVNRLGKCERAIYEVVRAEPDRVIPKEDIAEVSGYSIESSGFSNAISKLNTLGLIRREDGGIRLNPEVSSL